MGTLLRRRRWVGAKVINGHLRTGKRACSYASTVLWVRIDGHVRTPKRAGPYVSTVFFVRLAGVLAKISHDIHLFCGSRSPQILLFIYSDHSLDTKSQGLRCARY